VEKRNTDLMLLKEGKNFRGRKVQKANNACVDLINPVDLFSAKLRTRFRDFNKSIFLPRSKNFNYHARALCLGICSFNEESFQGVSAEGILAGRRAMYVYSRLFSGFSIARGVKKENTRINIPYDRKIYSYSRE